MSILDPERINEVLREGVAAEFVHLFPVEGRQHRISLVGINTKEPLQSDDYASQKKARLFGRTWSVPIHGRLRLEDKATGKTLSEAETKLLDLPLMTHRFSFIIDGVERQVDNQWRRLPGFYSRIRANGEIEGEFNLVRGTSFRLLFNPDRKLYTLEIGNSHVPLYSALTALGVKDEDLAGITGKEILEENRRESKPKDVLKLARAFGGKPASAEEAATFVRDTFLGSSIREDISRKTLGVPAKVVDGRALLAASRKLLAIARDEEEPDNRDALHFKELHGVEDFVPERIRRARTTILAKIRNNLDRKTDAREVVFKDLFQVPVTTLFTQTGQSERPEQYNPVGFVSGRLKTTLMGEGGIESAEQVILDAKLVDESHIGVLDPTHTPDKEKTGVVLHLALGASKVGRDVFVNLYDKKRGELRKVPVRELTDKNVALPDQYRWREGKPVPVGDVVKVSGRGNVVESVSDKDVDYILPSARSLFDLATNLIPFIQNVSGGRVNMGSKYLEQAISLKNREVPLVQAGTGGKQTYAQIVGKYASHQSPVDGTVTAVKPGLVTIRRKDGKTSDVPIYDYYPLNDTKSFITAEPVVKVGDAVKKGDLLSDTNFTREGTLALGVNARVGFLSYKGLNHEDALVVSESLAGRLTSEHLYQESLALSDDVVLSRGKYRAWAPGKVTDEQATKLDDDGVARVGEQVKPGDTIIAALRRIDPTRESEILRKIKKTLAKPLQDAAVVWDGPEGVVQDVIKRGKEVLVLVKTEEPAEPGDKISPAFGAKGVISVVLPDNEMPRDKDGVPLDILFEPTSIPRRVNVGFVYEALLGKAAKKAGGHFVVNNFEPDPEKRVIHVKGHYRTVETGEGMKEVWVEPHTREIDYAQEVGRVLKQHGLTDTEEIYDPETGKPIGKILTGYTYLMKLTHQAAKKLTARGVGYPNEYDVNRVPRGGGPEGAATLGTLGLYALLAHGSTQNIRELMTVKSDKGQDAFWSALQAGEFLPPPKAPFIYEKFVGYLRAMGVDVEKKGSSLNLVPLTDAEIVTLGTEVVQNDKLLRAKDLKPEKGGLFDPDITGGLGGTKWARVPLAEPVPNPLFEKAVAALLSLTPSELQSVASGEKGLKDGRVVEPGEGPSGGAAIEKALKDINIEKDLAAAEEAAKTARRDVLDRANKKVRYLRALKASGLGPEVYVLHNLPILPPLFRPLAIREDGSIARDDVNDLYRAVIQVNEQLATFPEELPDEERGELRGELHDAIRAVYGMGGTSLKSEAKGILDIISGKPAKIGFFQGRMIARKTDLVAKGVIIPDNTIGLDEIGLPYEAAKVLFEPFVVRKLVGRGYVPLEARERVEKDDPVAKKILEEVLDERPVLVERHPALHKFNVMGFRAKVTGGKSIKVHPLVLAPASADFDGDVMSVFVPVTAQAVEEAFQMLPSKNLFSPATGAIVFKPMLDAQLGLFFLTREGKAIHRGFRSVEDALAEHRAGKLAIDDVVAVHGAKTTPGRLMVSEAFPEPMRQRVASTLLDAKVMGEFLSEVGKKHKQDFGSVVQKLKDLGFNHAYTSGISFSLSDFRPIKSIRDKLFVEADHKAASVWSSTLPLRQKKQAIVKIYGEVSHKLDEEGPKLLKASGNRVFEAYAGMKKPSWEQVKQLLISPVLVMNARGEIVPDPIRNSYAEGLSVSDYWTASSGVRRGLIEKGTSVSKPGELSKLLVASTMKYVVTEPDCGTDRGVSLDSQDRNVLDRYLAKPVKAGSVTLSAGTPVTPEITQALRKAKVGSIVVRSPLKCRAKTGMCARCYGLSDGGNPVKMGTNVGILAAQSLGERSTQIALKQTHVSGAVPRGGLLSSFDRLVQVLRMPERIADAATLSRIGGAVKEIRKDPAGGFRVAIDDEVHYVPARRALAVKKGEPVRRGQPLTDGFVHPKELLAITGDVSLVQNYMTGELDKLFSSEGIRRRNAEVVVKAMTDMAEVEEPAEHPGYLRGDLAPVSDLEAYNREHPEAHVRFKPTIKGIDVLPYDTVKDWIARLNYRRLKEGLVEAAQEGWSSDIHGPHPIPGIVFAEEFGKPPPGVRTPY